MKIDYDIDVSSLSLNPLKNKEPGEIHFLKGDNLPEELSVEYNGKEFVGNTGFFYGVNLAQEISKKIGKRVSLPSLNTTIDQAEYNERVRNILSIYEVQNSELLKRDHGLTVYPRPIVSRKDEGKRNEEWEKWEYGGSTIEVEDGNNLPLVLEKTHLFDWPGKDREVQVLGGPFCAISPDFNGIASVRTKAMGNKTLITKAGWPDNGPDTIYALEVLENPTEGLPPVEEAKEPLREINEQLRKL